MTVLTVECFHTGRCNRPLSFSASGGWGSLPPPRPPVFFCHQRLGVAAAPKIPLSFSVPAAVGGCRHPDPLSFSASGGWMATAPQTPVLFCLRRLGGQTPCLSATGNYG